MYKLFPEDITCITWICKVYSELYIQNKPSAISEWVNIREIYQKLLTLEPKNAMAKLAQAICYVDNEEKDYHSAKKNLLAVFLNEDIRACEIIQFAEYTSLLSRANDRESLKKLSTVALGDAIVVLTE
ncbi:hypothetical protein HHI36_002280 [Cryptolaemus montrouzieri]|uniref:Uncharacterized protein n=1 Tax=Cryptolaemus montrouzieri TaxID=559131 RepID=A0ABD2PA22_9CUCU